MSPTQCAAIILAAGYSSRMGRFKPIIKLDGVTITERLIGLYQERDVDVYLVAGFQKDLLISSLNRIDFTAVENPLYVEGMFSSIRAGSEAVMGRGYRSVFIHPVDIPLVRENSVSRLLATSQLKPQNILYPCFDGKRGHPPLVPGNLIASLLNWHGEGGLKSFLAEHSARAEEVELPDSNLLFDIDTPQDIPYLEERYRLLGIPSDAECEVILNRISRVSRDVQLHGSGVAELAREIGKALRGKGEKVDLDLVWAVGRLHDIAKGKAGHEEEGGQIVRDMGFPAVADIIAGHRELERGSDLPETRIVFLADKYLQGGLRVSLEERYQRARERYGSSPEALVNIERRREQSLQVKNEIELKLGYPLERIVFG